MTLPLGRKTGGILSLKDKSAGYPHLVNTDPEPTKKADKDDKEPKPSQSSSQNSQSGQQKRQDHAPSPNWSPNASNYDNPRLNFQKNYGIQNAGITYNPNYPSPTNGNQGIRLPVVNPKEIDVRSAALQKQTSRGEMFQEGHKFNHGYQVYRYWQTAQDNENKFRDENFKQNSLFNPPQPSWPPAPQESYQPMNWWKDNPPPNFNANFNQPNYYSHLNTNISNPYQNMPFNQMQNPSKPENVMTPPNYLQSAVGPPQVQTLQNIVSSPNFNSSLNNYGPYPPSVGYDSTMYPQFNNNKMGYQMQVKPGYPAGKDLMGGLGFGNMMDLQQRNMGMNFNEPLSGDVGAMKNSDAIGVIVCYLFFNYFSISDVMFVK
jgi:hypothetical protein